MYRRDSCLLSSKPHSRKALSTQAFSYQPSLSLFQRHHKPIGVTFLSYPYPSSLEGNQLLLSKQAQDMHRTWFKE